MGGGSGEHEQRGSAEIRDQGSGIGEEQGSVKPFGSFAVEGRRDKES